MKADSLLLWIVVGAVAAVPCAAQMVVGNPFLPNSAHTPGIEVTPMFPHACDEVSVTIRGMMSASNCYVSSVDKRIEGSDIYIDLSWGSVGQGCMVLTPFEYTVSLGTFDPGTYTVHYGGMTATFTVMPTLTLPSTPTIPDTNPTDSLEQLKQQMRDRLNNQGGSTLDLPGVEINHVPWSDVTSIKEGISSLKIDPANPTPSDDVSVTVGGWKPSSNLVVGNATVQVEGQTIWLDLYWQEQPSAPPVTASGGSMDQMQACSFSLTVTQYDLTPPYEGVPYEYTKSLGTFAAGTYTLNVANHDKVSGSKSTSFTVKAAGSQSSPWPAWFADILSR
jgi:hypothetical protein